MLIRFKVSNFLSFKEETEFSMVASPERIHSNHVVKGKNQPNLLRSALIYGANAAGKSNFVKAIEYAGLFILGKPRSALNLPDKFKLNEDYHNKPSKFVFEIAINNKVYEYGFKVDYGAVKEEWLIELYQKKEHLLFRRQHKDSEKVTFDEINYLKKKSDREFLNFVQRSTPPSKLFLTHCKENNLVWFEDVFNWFENILEIIYPESFYNFEKMLQENASFRDFFRELNKKAGTGISSFEVVEFYGRTDEWGRPIGLIIPANSVTKSQEKRIEKSGAEKLSRLKLFHGNEEVPRGHIVIETHFEKEQESDGTQRLFDLAFPFYDLATCETPKVYIIDELERNLHTNLSYMLLKSYLEQEGKGQLIATTHDTHLLDLDLLRRDEIWFAEKDEHGATQLYSLYDFNPRYDKDIEKDYLLGRYGAIPFLGNLEFKQKLGKNGNSKNGKEK